MFSLYIATAYVRADLVERDIRPLAEDLGLTLVSRWHIGAQGPERLHDLPLPAVQYIAEKNDADLDVADAVLVLAHESMGETIAEMTRAILAGKIVAYVGPRYILSAYRPGVGRFSDPRDALAWIGHQLREKHGPDTLPAIEVHVP